MLKHVLSNSNYFFKKYFLESVENRLFLGEKFDIWKEF